MQLVSQPKARQQSRERQRQTGTRLGVLPQDNRAFALRGTRSLTLAALLLFQKSWQQEFTGTYTKVHKILLRRGLPAPPKQPFVQLCVLVSWW